MLIPLVMPVDIPLWMVAVSTIFAVVIGKEAFGGTGMNVFNPALLARAFIFFAYPAKITGDVIWTAGLSAKEGVVDGFSGATPLSHAAANHDITSLYSLSDLFFGFIPGSIGETSKLAILIGALILIISGVGSWRIILSSFVGGIIMTLIFNLVGANEYMRIDPLTQLMMGSFMFGMVFMATDPVTAAQTNKGKIIYGLLVGMFSIIIRVFNPAYPEGTMLAILLMNTFAPLIDHYVVEANISKRLKRATRSVKS
jgi:Na+-transporting NADH:ubiquinone oxidoreductase subunit B